MRRHRWVVLGLWLLVACWKPVRVGPPAKGVEPATFSHQTHFKLDLFCDACHDVMPEQKYALARPGNNQHQPCTTCHEEAFKKPPGPMCGVCHESVNPRKKGASPLAAYPAPHRESQLVRPFNHKKHLDEDNQKTALRCAACHELESKGSSNIAFGGHEACADCHGKELGYSPPHMKNCRGCHSELSLTTGRNFLQNDIRFTHAKHQRTQGGEIIDCLTCHASVVESESTANLPLPEMKDCATCHEDATRTPDRVRIAKCEVCHVGDVAAVALPANHVADHAVPDPAPSPALSPTDRLVHESPRSQADSERLLASLAPAFALPLEQSLARMQQRLEQQQRIEARVARAEVREERPLSSTRRPDDHTAVFRLRHEAAASSDNAKCRYCHLGLSGSPVSSCQDCHAVMRPRSHTARFRSVRHGRIAAIDQKPCATCHEVDYCTGCHNIPPPNHFPLARFRTQHSRKARVNSRTCLTCHTADATCFRCHDSEIR